MHGTETKAAGSRSTALPTCELSHVIERMRTKGNYKHWTDAESVRAEQEYRKYLLLCKLFPKVRLVPGRRVDAVWHQHILFTQQYAEDCQNYFGYFLHHQPHSRIKGESAEPSDGWVKTLELYEQTFGTKPDALWLKGQADCDCND